MSLIIRAMTLWRAQSGYGANLIVGEDTKALAMALEERLKSQADRLDRLDSRLAELVGNGGKPHESA